MRRGAGAVAPRGVATALRAGILAAALLAGGCRGPSGGPAGAAWNGESPMEVRLTGDHYEWKVRYPGADGTFDTADDRHTDRNVNVPAGVDVVMYLHSRDYIYTLALPHVGLNEAAVPDLEFSLRFPAGEPGEHLLKGDQMCGLSHPKLMGTLVVQEPAEFEAWLEGLRRGKR